MEEAKLETISEAPLAFIAHAVCQKCQAESMLTVTATGSGMTPILSDLNVQEFKKFISFKSVSYNDLLDLHALLKKEKLCNLLDKKESSQEKNPLV